MSEPTINVRRAVAATNFDFLNGAYKKSATRRLAAIVFVGFFLIAAMAVFLYGVNNWIMASSVDQERQTAFSQELSKSKELTSLSGSHGLSEKEMLAHIKERGDLILSVLKTAPPVKDLFTDVKNQLPSGISLTGISIETPVPVAPASTGNASGTASPKPSATPSAAKPSAAPAAPSTLTLTFKATSTDSIQSLNDALGTIAYVDFDDATWGPKDENGLLPVTVTGKFKTDAPSALYLYYSNMFNSDSQQPGNSNKTPSGSPSSLSNPLPSSQPSGSVKP